MKLMARKERRRRKLVVSIIENLLHLTQRKAKISTNFGPTNIRRKSAKVDRSIHWIDTTFAEQITTLIEL